MADHTRSLQEVKKLEGMMKEFVNESDRKLEKAIKVQELRFLAQMKEHDTTLRSYMTEIQSRILEQMQQLLSRDDAINGESGSRRTEGPLPRYETAYPILTRLTKVEFPRFDGSDLENWLFHCNRYFQIDETPEHAKVRLASLHLCDRALKWHHAFTWNRATTGDPPWEEYEAAVRIRFGDMIYDNPTANRKKLTQTGSLMEYIEAFEVCVHKTTLSDANVLDCFVSGLKEGLSYPVLMQGPKTLQ